MSLLRTNVDNLQSISRELMELSKKYNDLVDQFYRRINGINGRTNEWFGEDADYFINSINKERNVYQTIGRVMRDYSIDLDSFSKSIDDLSKLDSM